LALLVPVLRAGAQSTVRGVVRDSATAGAIPAAVVTALDANGKVVARSMTNVAGRFTVSAANAIKLRVVRIGFSPRDVALPVNSTDGPIAIAMAHIPPLLEAVQVSGQELCPESSERGGAFAVWDQAKAGLLATVVARDANPAIATTLTFERREASSDGLVHQQVVRTTRGSTTRPFIAPASPAVLAQSGYMKESEATRTFYAPDADVLLDDSFASTHCFHLQNADAIHLGQIGLAFTPMRGLSHAVDVAGVIWTDGATTALASVDFRYTGVQDAGDHGPSGHIEFRTVSNGIAFVERWNLRIPILVYPAVTSGVRIGGRYGDTPRSNPTADETYVAGGSVLAAQWPDSVTWSSEVTGVTGVVTDHGNDAPLAGVVASVAGTSDTSTTDDAGKFSIPLIPGRYTLVVRDTSLVAFARDRAESRVVDVALGKPANARVVLPAMSETIAQMCRIKVESANPAMLTGRVYFPDDKMAKSARIRVTWNIPFEQTLNASPLMEHLRELDRDADVDARGRFVVCGVPFEQSMHVQLIYKGGSADTTVTIRRVLHGSLEWKRP
jgi:hypothetical protein